VLVCVRQRADTLALQVWDTGIGIAPDKHAEMFEEFLQPGNPERDQRKGLGMGLAIAAGLARSLQAVQHGWGCTVLLADHRLGTPRLAGRLARVCSERDLRLQPNRSRLDGVCRQRQRQVRA